MTTKERKTIQNFINKLTELEAEQDKAFKELQNLNVTCGDGDKWCCLESNLKTLFENACKGIAYKMLTASVMCNGEKVLTVKCDTEVDGSMISALIAVARPRETYRFVRAMWIAC